MAGAFYFKMYSYKKTKETPLTPEEIEEKIKETEEEMQEVLDWKKEEDEKFAKDEFKTHQAKSACKRNLKKVARRIDSVKGMLMYWGLRKKGKKHFYASIELNEYWAGLKEKAKKEKEEKIELEKPEILKGK